MKKKWWIILGALVVVVIVALNFMSEGGGGMAVNATEVKSLDLVEEVSASGRIQPKTSVDITAELNAEIIAIPVNEGQWVEKGQLLLVLDTVQEASITERARYALDEMRARLDGAKSTRDQAVEEFERQQRLYSQELTSETNFKNAKYASINAESAYTAMLAQLKQLEASYEQQLDNLEKARIVAPMDGVITYLDAEVGEIAAAQTPYSQGRTLMTISNLSVFEVEVEVDETEIDKINLQQAAKIEVDAFPDTTFEGSVVEIGNTAILAQFGSQDQSTNFKVKVTFVDANPRLRPGMSATVDITTAREDDVLAVPFSAVVVRAYDLDSLESARASLASAADDGSGIVEEVQAAENGSEERADTVTDRNEREEHKGVFVVREGVVQFVKIETGIADQRNIQVLTGLEPGDTVVSGPYRALRNIQDGNSVQATIENDDDEERS